ncbi:hypothetical protein [Lysinibacillus sp. NPDC092081]|uniref:hypothetical protein n=1 Tax=Lysinibacillus sp. NPDC092081 TaxID=3364131 RepID=UPI00380C095F
MNKIIIALTFFIIATIVYSATLIATGLYTIAFPRLFSDNLLEIGKIPITISIIMFVLGLGFVVLYLRDNK